jgi:hypothetical protein
MNEDGPPVLVWDRKVEGQFPELKHLVSFPNFHGDFLKREMWALRRNSGFGIISSQKGRLAIQTNEMVDWEMMLELLNWNKHVL